MSIHDVGGATSDITTFSAGAASTFASGLNAPNGLAFDSSGNLYVANSGDGTVSKVDAEGEVSTFASGFTDPVGLAFDTAGDLYVSYGENAGAIGQVTPSGVVSVFADYNTGLYYPDGLAFDSSGNLYAANWGWGTVTRLTPTGAATTLPYDFGGIDNATGLAFDGSGNLYVSNSYNGTVSKVSTGGVVTVFAAGFSFPAALAFDSSGNLYVVNAGNDTVSMVTPDGVMSTFVSSGLDQPDGLAFDSSGNLYVANAGNGTVTEVPVVATVTPVTTTATVTDAPLTAAATLSTLASFNGTNGAAPPGGLVEDSSGNLFGTTMAGGPAGGGTVFEVAAGSGVITTLASFNGANGAQPQGGLIEDSSGNLFDVTMAGGPAGGGTVFEVAAGSGVITTLASFNGTNGVAPQGGLVEDSSGNLFGTTIAGGLAGGGTVFEVAAGSGVITTLASFNGTNGVAPQGGLVEDSSGNLFGTTMAGGPAGGGTVFEVAAGSGVITTLAFFNGINGAFPQGGLVEDSSGNLFGTTMAGGPAGGGGTVFEVAAGSGVITTLASFNGANGAQPQGGLIEDSSGNLFGTTMAGGPAGGGTVFEVPAGSNVIATLASFNGANGVVPQGGLLKDSSGNLFGVTAAGGPGGGGTVFEVQVAHVTPPVATAGQAFSNQTVFQFADANPDATAADYTAVVTLGDGNSVTLDSSGVVSGPPGAGGQIVPDPNGGFDVQLSYTYAEAFSDHTFSVQVTDVGGATTGASTNTFSVASATVDLSWSGAGNPLVLTETSPGATPTIVISEPSPNESLLEIDLARVSLRRHVHDIGSGPDLPERRFARNVPVCHDQYQRGEHYQFTSGDPPRGRAHARPDPRSQRRRRRHRRQRRQHRGCGDRHRQRQRRRRSGSDRQPHGGCRRHPRHRRGDDLAGSGRQRRRHGQRQHRQPVHSVRGGGRLGERLGQCHHAARLRREYRHRRRSCRRRRNTRLGRPQRRLSPTDCTFLISRFSTAAGTFTSATTRAMTSWRCRRGPTRRPRPSPPGC